jgi:MoaA/NifB/PqqE/SkfB family radical SAM enzyme
LYTANSYNTTILSGWRKKLVFSIIWLGVFKKLLVTFKRPTLIFKAINHIREFRNKHSIYKTFPKIAVVDRRVFFNCNVNGWPSNYFYRSMLIESRKGLEMPISNLENIKMVQIAFTKKCPLNCEHCFEGPVLNKKDTLTLEQHKQIVKKLQDAGVSMIEFGGGDPMTRINDLVEILNSARKTADFWVYTSGFNFTEENARRLKKAGLTGVSIGLDHYLSEKHNAFRRNQKAFDWALEAAKNAKNAKLVITATICVTKEFCSMENLFNYVKFAQTIGASFVQILEPRAAGNYEGKDVLLNSQQIQIMKDFFIDVNTNPVHADLPIVDYPGYFQRKNKCAGAGNHYLYIDTDGYINSCPFCRNKKTFFLDENHEESIESLKTEGCDLPNI